ncbi:MAG TPA: glycosyltransferase [Chloroflexia bacterium]|nr:glycosyltransferase [Chloroflexia bacterium]
MSTRSEQWPVLLYLGHLRWDHVWQRPQQLMTRFAAHTPVIYVDPPEVTLGATGTSLQEQPGVPGVQVWRPVFPGAPIMAGERTYEDFWLEMLPAVLERVGAPFMLWVSSPLADYLVAEARERAALVVYDCMDDLASFRDGTPALRRQEDHLLQMADLLFTGGFSMYEARKDRHPRAYCFPSGVDVAHYAQTHDPALAEPAALSGIPHPRMGYFGVLDERIDWPLIADVAARCPEWQWVLVGPTAKVEDDELPQAPNIHYLGQQAYTDLPAFLKGFDLATMPFALNEATRFISPTKTLEYLAGGKPVISSSVPDVVAFYSEIVHLADGADAWVAATSAVLQSPPAEQAARLAAVEPLLHESTWDSIAARMGRLITDQLARPAPR